MNDYAELPLHLEDYDEDDPRVTLIVHLHKGDDVWLTEVNGAVRSRGWWFISRKVIDRPATTYMLADNVSHFTVIEQNPHGHQGWANLSTDETETNN